jgi:hypothetical protein
MLSRPFHGLREQATGVLRSSIFDDPTKKRRSTAAVQNAPISVRWPGRLFAGGAAVMFLAFIGAIMTWVEDYAGL